MIVICPSCSNKYSVQAEVIGSGKMVRCAICGAIWRQAAIDESIIKKQHAFDLIKWTFFWFVVFVTIFSLFFAKSAVIKIWPSVVDFYEAVGIHSDSSKNSIVVQNVSNFFISKNNELYMGLRGELINTSNEVHELPRIVISLIDDDAVSKNKSHRYKKIWTHDLAYRKLLPNQKVVFETDPQNVPCNNLICDIKLDVL